MSEKANEVDKLAHLFKIPHTEVVEKVEKLSEENKSLQTEVNTLKEESAVSKIQSFISRAEDLKDGKLFISKIDAIPSLFMKPAIEKLSSKLGNSIIVLTSVQNPEQISICVKVSDNYVKAGVNAGNIVKAIAEATGGRGGGRPNYAQGGGKDATKLDETLIKIKEEIIKSL